MIGIHPRTTNQLKDKCHGLMHFMKKMKNIACPSKVNGGRFKHIFHQIKEPLGSLTSMCTQPIATKEYTYLSHHINMTEIENPNSIEMIMSDYYQWHTALNHFGFPTFKIENLYSSDNDTAINTLRWLIRESELEKYANDKELLNGRMSNKLFKTLHTKVNGRKHRPKLTWDELFLLNEEYAHKIYTMATVDYGYKYPEWNYAKFNATTRHTHPFANNPKALIQCGSSTRRGTSKFWKKIDKKFKI